MALDHRHRPTDDDLIVIAAGCLARIRVNAKGVSTARRLGGSEKAEDRTLPESRFLRLLRARDPADLFDQGRRLTAFLKAGAPVGDLGRSLCFWLDDPAVRRQWAEDYYGLGSRTDTTATPASSNQSE
jgi:CRISPR type I-E-associated protein CasB/Cse2